MFGISGDGFRQEVKFTKSVEDIVNYYILNIEILEILFPGGRKLTKREKEFLATVIMVIDSGFRNIFSEEAADIYRTVAKINSIQDARTYSNKPSVRRWVKREKVKGKVYYRMWPAIEGLLKNKTVEYKIFLRNGGLEEVG